MKKLLFGLMATVLLLITDSASAQTSEKAAPWPYGCRKHTFTVGFYSSEMTLCCAPANWKFPPIDCVEVDNKKSSTTNLFYQYVMLSEIEKNIGKIITEKSIIVNSEKDIVEDNSSYRIIKKEYPIETNDLNDRFIKLEFIKIK